MSGKTVQASAETDRLIVGEQVDSMFAVTKTTRYRYIARGIIPKPIKLAKTAARWSYNECVEALENFKKAARAESLQ